MLLRLLRLLVDPWPLPHPTRPPAPLTGSGFAPDTEVSTHGDYDHRPLLAGAFEHYVRPAADERFHIH